MSARTLLLDALAAKFAERPELRLRLIRGPRATDSPDARAMVIARTRTYEPLAEAPLSKVMWSGYITIVSKHTDLIRAEDELEELYEALFTMSRSSQYRLGQATLTTYAQNEDGSPAQIALEVEVTSIFNQE